MIKNTQEVNKEGVSPFIFGPRGLETAGFSGTLNFIESFVSKRC